MKAEARIMAEAVIQNEAFRKVSGNLILIMTKV